MWTAYGSPLFGLWTTGAQRYGALRTGCPQARGLPTDPQAATSEGRYISRTPNPRFQRTPGSLALPDTHQSPGAQR
jgi:hypothetical protein